MDRDVYHRPGAHSISDVPDPYIRSLVMALDGCRVEGEAVSWTASVHGVHSDGRSWWIQVSRADDASASVILRCSRFVTIPQALASLRRWLPAPTETLQILDGMSSVS